VKQRRIRILLAEKGADSPRVEVDVQAGRYRKLAFLAMNPMGTMPVLDLDDGTHLAESMSICRYSRNCAPSRPYLARRCWIGRAPLRAGVPRGGSCPLFSGPTDLSRGPDHYAGRHRAFACCRRAPGRSGDWPVAHVVAELRLPEMVAFNLCSNVIFPILGLTAPKILQDLENGGHVRVSGGARRGAGHAPARPRHHPVHRRITSLRGGSGFAAFAGGNAALRMLAQSMARERGSQGLHIAHAIFDCDIDTEFMRDHFPKRYALKDRDGS
jgi:hypothetical protein